MRLYGLIGYPLAQSFSKKYFTEKFSNEGISDARYELFQIPSISELPDILRKKDLCGLNVTIPYKKEVLPFLQDMDDEARKMGACNCIKISPTGRLKGFNTDAPAFEQSVKLLLQPWHTKALVLGTGGAAQAIKYTLDKMGIENKSVSRYPIEEGFSYAQLNQEVVQSHLLIVNTTPLGSFPKTEAAVPIPYEFLTKQHYLYDLVYNPAQTLFLKKGQERGTATKNGYDMLVGQAELSWKIWNDPAL